MSTQTVSSASIEKVLTDLTHLRSLLPLPPSPYLSTCLTRLRDLVVAGADGAIGEDVLRVVIEVMTEVENCEGGVGKGEGENDNGNNDASGDGGGGDFEGIEGIHRDRIEVSYPPNGGGAAERTSDVGVSEFFKVGDEGGEENFAEKKKGNNNNNSAKGGVGGFFDDVGFPMPPAPPPTLSLGKDDGGGKVKADDVFGGNDFTGGKGKSEDEFDAFVGERC